MTLGDLVKKYRTDNNISMEEFSKKCNLSKGYISMLENNINPRNNKPIAPTLPTIQKIALGMNTDIDTILKILDKNQEISLEANFSESNKEEKFDKNLNKIHENNEKDLSVPEYRIIEKYRQLDRHGQKIVDFILNEEHERSMTLIETYKNIAPIGDLDDIPDTFEEMEKKLVKESIRSDVG